MTRWHRSLALLDPVARICLAALFVNSGLSKFGDLAGVAGVIASKGFPLPSLLAPIAALVEVVAGAALALGVRARIAAAALLAYTLLVTPLFHGFWAFDGPERAQQYMQFMKNLWAAGGLALVVRFGAPAFGLDALIGTRTAHGPARPAPAATAEPGTS